MWWVRFWGGWVHGQLQLEEAAPTKLKLLTNLPSPGWIAGVTNCLQRSRVSLECVTC